MRAPPEVVLVGSMDFYFEPVAEAARAGGYPVTRYRMPADFLAAADPLARAGVLYAVGNCPVSRAHMAAAPALRAVISPWTGTEGFDERAATELGILVGNGHVPENIDSMAEAAVLMILAGLYDLAGALERFRTSDVWSSAPLTARMLKGKTIGLLGYGGIARGIVQRLSGWSADFCATTRHPPKDPGFAVRFLPLDEMLAASDVVCVLAPITDETRGLLDARRLALTKQGSVLICLSRGGIIDETALAVLARAGHFGAVCLDVFEREPLPKDSPLRELKNALLTPHSIGLTREMRPRLIEAGVVSVMRVLKGEAPLYVRNPEVLPAWRARWQG